MAGFLPAEWEEQTLDMKFHWVSKNGPALPSKLTSGINLVPTVCRTPLWNIFHDLTIPRTLLKHASRLTLSSSELLPWTNLSKTPS